MSEHYIADTEAIDIIKDIKDIFKETLTKLITSQK